MRRKEIASSIVERFDRIRRDTPDRPLIHLPLARTTISAAGLWDASEEQRRRLERLSLGGDHLVIYAGGNRPDLLGLWLACRTLGIALMPVDGGTTATEIAALGQRFGAACAIVSETAAASGILGEGALYGEHTVLVPLPTTPAPHLYQGAAVLKVTSGSTGLPKATFTTEPHLLEDAAHIVTAMDIRPDDCQMAAIPLSHAYAIGNLVLPLLLQGTAIVLREGFVPHQFAADAAVHGARVFPGVPFMFEHFANHLSPGGWPPRLDRLISAGARLESSTVRAFHHSFGLKIHSFYGTSETGGITFDDSPGFAEEGSVGRPMPGVEVTLRPEDGAPADGGRVHVAGGAVASRYVGGELRDDGFTPGGFLTGDFGRFSGQGHLVLTGRASSFINVAGRKVQPEEVEAVLRQMPGVTDVRVIGASDPARGQQIVACIVCPGGPLAVLDVRRFCGARLPPYKIPRTIVQIEAIPLTERGKTDRQRLQAIVDERLREAPGAGVL